MSILETVTHKAFSLKRSAGSPGEAMFAAYLAKLLPIHMIDVAGNLHLRIGKSQTLFMAHMDTVSWAEGIENSYINEGRYIMAKGNDVLGADDGVGCGILAHMIDNNVPGYYVFSRGEEVGGVGAQGLADGYLVPQNTRAVVCFDRKGTDSVITHQGGQRTCSERYALALCDALNNVDDDFMYSPDTTGSFCDSAVMADLFPNCTNISCGYEGAHTVKEFVDMLHVERLANAAVRIDWAQLLKAKNATAKST